MSKAFGLFVNCDKLVGGDFEKRSRQLEIYRGNGREKLN